MSAKRTPGEWVYDKNCNDAAIAKYLSAISAADERYTKELRRLQNLAQRNVQRFMDAKRKAEDALRTFLEA